MTDSLLREVGLHLAVATMRRGERCRLQVAPQYAFGERGSFSFPSVPPNADVEYEVRRSVASSHVSAVLRWCIAAVLRSLQYSHWRSAVASASFPCCPSRLAAEITLSTLLLPPRPKCRAVLAPDPAAPPLACFS